MTNLLRKAINEAESFRAVERATGVKRQSLMKFVRCEQSLRLDLADKLATYFGLRIIRTVRTAKNVQDAVQAAINSLLDRDADLLKRDVREEAISHRLAVYLEPLFPDYNVDAEYNKHGDDPKYYSKSKRGGFRPDILVQGSKPARRMIRCACVRRFCPVSR